MKILKRVLPIALYNCFLSFYKKINKNKFLYWEGNYSSWALAQSRCQGYDESGVLEKVKDSALKVKNGMAVFERDGVLFYEDEYSTRFLDALLTIASHYNGKLSVLDFGGSLGSTYFQYRKKIAGLRSVSWCVVEQNNFVDCGKSMFEDNILKFEYTIDDAIDRYNPNLLLLGSVLQYLPDPYEWLQKFTQKKFPYIIIERTPFIKGENDRLTVQHVPEKIYKASYPGWFLSETKFIEFISKNYEVVSSYLMTDKANIPSEFKGLFLKLK